MVTILRSGFALKGTNQVLTKEEILSRAFTARLVAQINAVQKAIETHIGDVAMKTGAMRQVLQQYLLEQAAKDSSKLKSTIRMRIEDLMPRLGYIEWHWGEGPTGLFYYKDPTTEGTKPIDPQEWGETIRDVFNDEFPKIGASLGLKITGGRIN